nr:unnamed protein product [Digitaria exilis]
MGEGPAGQTAGPRLFDLCPYPSPFLSPSVAGAHLCLSPAQPHTGAFVAGPGRPRATRVVGYTTGHPTPARLTWSTAAAPPRMLSQAAFDDP